MPTYYYPLNMWSFYSYYVGSDQDSQVLSNSSDPNSQYAFLESAIGVGSGILYYDVREDDYVLRQGYPDCVEDGTDYEEQQPTAAPPTVTISTPTTTTITAGAVDTSGNAKQYTFTATAQQSGGDYLWSVGSGSGITLSNKTSATVSVVGTTSGTPTIKVTYTLNGQSGTAQKNLSVLKADSIYVDNDSTVDKAAGGGLTYKQRQIEYTIKSGTQTITDAIFVRENVPATVDSCSNVVLTGAAGNVTSNYVPGTAYQFTDFLGAPPLNYGTSCHFSFTNQQWQQKNADGTYTSIGTVGAVYVVSNAEATVNGNNTSLVGTTFH